MAKKKTAVLAYSGGLDTSVILVWLKERYDCEVCAFTADLGQGEELESARKRAEELGAAGVYIEDLREEFVRDFVFPMLRGNAVYEAEYLLGTSIARPLIAKRMIEVAKEVGAFAVAHGATGKGNDQIRFELGVHALAPDMQIIAPWREWDMGSRSALLAYAEKHGVAVDKKPGGESPYSVDANLLHVSYEGNELEDPARAPEAAMWRWTTDPCDAPDKPRILEIEFENGDPCAVDGEGMSPATLLAHLNEVAGAHGVGRTDIVENRYIGMKSRGCYETPGGAVLHKARRALESITLDREVQHLKDDLTPRYARLIYNGYWWSPEREAMQKMMDADRERVCGAVRLRLYKGGVAVLGRSSDMSLFDDKAATFEDDAGAYDQRDAAGFIRLNALRLRTAALRDAKRDPKRRG